MRSKRVAVAVGVLLLLGVLVGAGLWYQRQRDMPGGSTEPATAGTEGVVAKVTSGADRGPGSLREALFIAAASERRARISIEVPQIVIESALPPMVNPQGVSIVAMPAGAVLDAQALASGAVLDVAGAGVSIEGLVIRNCAGAAILLRAARFRLHASAIENCDVGIEVADNASDILVERNRFTRNRIGIRFASSSPNTSVANNEFQQHRDAGMWAVRSAPESGSATISVHDNTFSGDRLGVLLGNVAMLLERNTLTNAREAAVHIVGAGAIVRANRISGGAAMGIVGENARDAVIESNEIDHLTAYGIMFRGSSNVLVRANRLHNCGYGLAFVLGDSHQPSTAADNTILEPKFNGIDVIGDSPILRRNQVVRPRALPLKVTDFQAPDGATVRSKPFLEGNNFNAPGAPAPVVAPAPGPTVAAEPAAAVTTR